MIVSSRFRGYRLDTCSFCNFFGSLVNWSCVTGWNVCTSFFLISFSSLDANLSSPGLLPATWLYCCIIFPGNIASFRYRVSAPFSIISDFSSSFFIRLETFSNVLADLSFFICFLLWVLEMSLNLVSKNMSIEFWKESNAWSLPRQSTIETLLFLRKIIK